MPYDHGVALGEAFIKVRADLKPFSKDLEKGLKTILQAAEKKLKLTPQIDPAFHKTLKENTSNDIEEGFEEGAKKGGRKALTAGQKFFASLADFIDDGLSAIPAEVKAGILLGVAGAIAVFSPLIAGSLSASITGGIALGIVTAGVALAAQLKPVEDQFTALGRSILGDLRQAATVFIDPLLESAFQIDETFNDLRDEIKILFAEAALDVKPLTTALTGFIRNILPGLEISLRRARPIIEALAVALPKLATDLSRALFIIADGSPAATQALRDLLTLIGQLILSIAYVVRALTEMWYWLRIVGMAATRDFGGAMALITQHQRDSALASGEVVGGLGDLDVALGKTAAEAEAANNAISDLIKTQLTGLDATIDYEQAIDDLADSIKRGNKNFDVTQEKGRQNLRLVEAAISAAARQRDVEIQRAQETGRSVDDINAAYQREIATIEQVIGKNAAQDKGLKDLFATAHKAPSDVTLEVKTPGLQNAINNFKELASAAAKAAAAAVAAINRGAGAGLQNVKQFALGDIVTQPTISLVGEAGYKEAIIPDPAVMPQRAMELSNKFGLTDMISNALGGGGQTVVNVYLGTEKLAQFVDYRVGVNNQRQAMALTQGPRGI